MKALLQTGLAVLAVVTIVGGLSHSTLITAISAPALQVAQSPQTGSVEGIVLLAGSTDPIPEVNISLLPAGTRGTASMPVTKTEPNGKFSLKDVPAGSYNLRIQKLGYFDAVPTSTAYLITMPLTVAPQQQIKDLEFRLVQGGVIKGRVLDGNGQPLMGVPVSALLPGYAPDGNPRFSVLNMNVLSTGGNPTAGAGAPATNDKGEYRLYWLAPGKYYLRSDFNPTPAPSVGRGSGVVQQAVTTYYPSTNDPAQAGPLLLSPAAEITADIVVRRNASVTISGKLVETAPSPASVSRRYILYMFPRDPRVLSDRNPREVGNVTMGPPGATGSFTIPFVTPGEYYLAARFLTGGYAQMPIDVKRENIDGVMLNVAPAVNVKIQAALQGGESGAFKLDSISALGLRPEFFETPWATTRVTADGSGQPLSLAQGRYVFQMLVPPGSSDAYLADIQQNGRSVLREMIDVNADSAPLTVTINPAGGRIEGTVRDSAGKISTANVIAVPVSRSRVPLYITNFRGAAEASGRFSIGNLPPGDYKLFAFEGIPAGADMNSEFMARIDALATRVTISQGDRINQDLRRISRDTTDR